MFGSTGMRPRGLVTGLAVSALTGSLAFASPAVAASGSGVRSHLRRAEAALRALSASDSVQGGAQLDHRLQSTTSQFGIAEGMSLNLAAQASTPDIRQRAAEALAGVATAEAHAESVLNRVEDKVDGAASAPVAEADLQITQGQALALNVLGKLGAGAVTHSVSDDVATVSARAGMLLGDVVDSLTVSSGCQPDVPQLASSEAASVESGLDGQSISDLARIVDAGGSLLGQVTNGEVTHVTAQIDSSGGCNSETPTAGDSASSQVNVVANVGL